MPRLSVTTADTAVQAAVSGIGVTRLLYYQVADAVGAGALRIVPEGREPEPAAYPSHPCRARADAAQDAPLHRFRRPRLRERLDRLNGKPAL